jgi:hypothetical protein
VKNLALSAAAILSTVSAVSAAGFHPLTGGEIRRRLAGMVVTDHVHWRFEFRADGSLPSTSLGRGRIGSWRVERDRLCMVEGLGDAGCYAVWLDGRAIQLRPENEALPIEEGTLERP